MRKGAREAESVGGVNERKRESHSVWDGAPFVYFDE